MMPEQHQASLPIPHTSCISARIQTQVWYSQLKLSNQFILCNVSLSMLKLVDTIETIVAGCFCQDLVRITYIFSQ